MKYKLKFISKLLLFVTFLMLTNCSKEEFENQIKNSKNKNDISFEQFKKETGLTNFETSINIRQITNTSSAKTADGKYELSDFNIETDIIKRLELNSKTTYTFKITPLEIVNPKSIYNLTVHKKDGIWEKSIVEFIPTDENYQMLVNGLTEQIHGRMKLLYQTNSVTCTTISIVTFHCPYGEGGCSGTNGNCDALEGHYCTGCATYTNLTFCTTDENGNNGSGYDGSVPVPSDGNSNNGSYTGGGNNSTGIGTSPNNTIDEHAIPINPNLEHLNLNQDDPANPCDQLKALKNKPNFISKMTSLKNNISGVKEKGFILRDINANECSAIVEGDANGNITYPYENQTSEELYKTYGTAHNHLENNPTQIGIFTPEDLGNLLLNAMIETSPDNPYHTSLPNKAIIYVITSKGLFSLKVNDLNKLKAFVQDYATWSFDETNDYMKQKFQNPNQYNITPTSTHDEQVTGFLRFMQDKDLGVDLFEGNKDTFGDWKKLTLVSDGSGNYSTRPIPCN